MTPTPEEFSLIDQALEAAKANVQCAQNIVALFKSGKSPAPPPPLTRDRIAATVEGLFVNAMGQKATRLVLIDDKEKTIGSYGLGDLGGMCREAVVAHLCRELGVEG